MAELSLAERAAKQRKPRNGDRWARFNQFVDITMRTLTPAQQAVWTYLYRHERNGTADSSIRQIAEGVGLTRNGAHLALKALIEAGLVEVLKRSKSHAEASVYRLHVERRPSN